MKDWLEQMRDYIEDRDITCRQLAELTGLSRLQISNRLSGRTAMLAEDYARICGALGVGMDCFLEPVPPLSAGFRQSRTKGVCEE